MKKVSPQATSGVPSASEPMTVSTPGKLAATKLRIASWSITGRVYPRVRSAPRSPHGPSFPEEVEPMDVIEWLMDSDPAIRWQVMRGLADAPAADVAAERARIAGEGWGARLLALQRPDGQWEGGTPTFSSEGAANWWRSLPPAQRGTLFPQWTS